MTSATTDIASSRTVDPISYSEIQTWSDGRVKPGPNGCVLWTGTIDHKGYGSCHIHGHTVMAHKLIYEALVKVVPDGHQLHHTCSNKNCVNPDHLELMTPADHAKTPGHPSQVNAAKTHCSNGHEFTEENTYWRQDRPGSRLCKECRKEGLSRWRQKQQDRG